MKYSPRYSFSRHCTSFDDRRRQRDFDYAREVKELQSGLRKKAAAEFRTRWEEQDTTHVHDTEYPATHRVGAEDSHPHYHASFSPFRRQRRMDRAVGRAGEYRVAFSANRANDGRARRKLEGDDSKTVVGREHLRGVVNLMLSDASSNAFAVIEALEGLLAVSDGVGSEIVAQVQSAKEESFSCTSETLPSKRYERSSSSKGINEAFLTSEHVSPRCHQGEVRAGVCEPVDQCNNSDASGPALCVSLGALPAVLRCLLEHAGHVRIETLAIKLLRAFAADRSASEVIRGNTSVLRICVARMLSRCSISAACSDVAACNANIPTDHGRLSREVVKDRETLVGDRAGGLEVSDNETAGINSVDNHDCTLACFASEPMRPRSSTTNVEGEAPSTILRATFDRKEREEPATQPGSSTGGTVEVIPASERDEDANNIAPTATAETTLATDILLEQITFVLSVTLENNPACQSLLLSAQGVEVALAVLSGPGTRCSKLAESCLHVLERLSRSHEGRQRALQEGGVEVTLSTIEGFRQE